MKSRRSWFDKLTTSGVSAAFTPVQCHGITTSGVSAAFTPVQRHGITTSGVSAAFTPVQRHGITTSGYVAESKRSAYRGRHRKAEGRGCEEIFSSPLRGEDVPTGTGEGDDRVLGRIG
jgi:hypothetical protein